MSRNDFLRSLACTFLTIIVCSQANGFAQETSLPELGKAPKKLAKLRKKETPELAENLALLEEIRKLRWETTAESGEEARKISLQKIFKEAPAHSIAVRQAEAQWKDAEAQFKDLQSPNLFNLINPLDAAAVKKASEHEVQAAASQLQATRQKALLESARLYADLVQAFLNKYLAYQAIEQGRNQLKADQQRFVAGEANHFDVILTQMALIDRYGKYLGAENAYRTASLTMAGNMGAKTSTPLVPEGVVLHDGDAAVAPLRLLPENLSLEKILAMTRSRPDLQALNQHRQALGQLLKSPFAQDRQKKEADLRQLDLQFEQASRAALTMAEKAFYDYGLAAKNLELAHQRYELAGQFLHQLEVSYQAGFSSLKDLLDAQIEWSRAKTGLISAQTLYNLSQVQLVYEMGLLSEEMGDRPLTLPPNLL